MRANARSLVVCLLASAPISITGCGGGRTAKHDTLALSTAARWNEPMVLGFADTAFALLLRDGELGVAAARRASVRQLATRMRRDYRALAARTDSLAARRGVTPRSPSGLEFIEQHRAAAADLRNAKNRRQFDDRYLEHVVTGHQQVRDRMPEAIRAAGDESVRRLLEDAQRRLEANLAEATRLKNLGARAGVTRSGGTRRRP